MSPVVRKLLSLFMREIIKSVFVAILWVAIVTYSALPRCIEDASTFVNETCAYAGIGKTLFFIAVVFAFDLFIQVLYIDVEHFSNKSNLVRYLFCGILLWFIITIIEIVIACNMGIKSIFPLLISTLTLLLMKCHSLYISGYSNRLSRRREEITELTSI